MREEIKRDEGTGSLSPEIYAFRFVNANSSQEPSRQITPDQSHQITPDHIGGYYDNRKNDK